MIDLASVSAGLSRIIQPALGRFYKAGKFSFDFEVTDTPKCVMMQDRQIWSSFYYLIISVKDIGTSNVVYVGFSPDEQNIPLLFPVGAIELEAPSQYYHTTDDIYVKTDTGTATINIWGVLF